MPRMTCSFAYNLYNSNYCQLGNLKPYKEPDKNEKFECPIRKKNSIGNNLTNRIYERKKINNKEKKKKTKWANNYTRKTNTCSGKKI